jgi:hypothetical protein
MRKIVLSVLFTAIWMFLWAYLFMPALATDASVGIYFNLAIYFGIMAFIWADYEYGEGIGIVSVIFTIIASGIFVGVIIVGGFISSSGWVNTTQYRGLIGEIKQTEFTANVQPIAVNQMLIVDDEIAQRVGEKVLGSDPGLGSRSKLGKFTLQAVNHQLYWIAPIVHSGYFKWKRFGDVGTPGYVKVSATNQEDYALVTNVNGKDLHIVYQEHAYFSQDLERHVYINGYRSALYSDYTFEVDDDWNPYWTITINDSKIGFGGYDAVGVLVVDSETGKMTEYKTEDAPKWIDRIQPVDNITSQVDDWGNYIDGYWNLSGNNKIRVAGESSLVLGSDGRSYYYYGLTSDGNDNSTVGFVMVDTRTKKAHWFKQAGATEHAACESAEGKVQEKEYVGSDGITYNIDGYPTYEFLLKDKGGLMKLVSLVNVHDHTIVGIGESRQEAIQDYRSQMTNRGNTVSLSTSDMQLISISSKIFRIDKDIMKGNTFYKLILEKYPKILFTAGATISEELALTRDGDMVKIRYVKPNSNGNVSILNFDNLVLSIQKDSIQISNEQKLDTLRIKVIQQKSNEVVDQKINGLSSEEKRKLLDQMSKK